VFDGLLVSVSLWPPPPRSSAADKPRATAVVLAACLAFQRASRRPPNYRLRLSESVPRSSTGSNPGSPSLRSTWLQVRPFRDPYLVAKERGRTTSPAQTFRGPTILPTRRRNGEWGEGMPDTAIAVRSALASIVSIACCALRGGHCPILPALATRKHGAGSSTAFHVSRVRKYVRVGKKRISAPTCLLTEHWSGIAKCILHCPGIAWRLATWYIYTSAECSPSINPSCIHARIFLFIFRLYCIAIWMVAVSAARARDRLPHRNRRENPSVRPRSDRNRALTSVRNLSIYAGKGGEEGKRRIS